MTWRKFSRSKIWPLLFSAVIASQIPLSARTSISQDSELLASKLQRPQSSPASIKIISYNIRWRGDDLRKLIELFKTDKEIGGAAILGLQEVDRNKKRTLKVNTARLMAEELGM
ncbi:MAG: hypothetical protein M3362_24395 [Acidobacteriota bacterium]|nr:hypothetical protein [Acidobacteriota bacterium]